VELRQNDLRLTPEEGALFLSRTMEVDLPVETARTLTEHTEGWIRTIGSGNVYILDYLMDEVWKQQPPGVQQFLLQTSVLDRF
jgi:LuxR family maltose regulon positive regulatory protein